MIQPRPKFGQMIRGARLGFHWHPKYQAMIRVSVAGPASWLIEVCPPEQLPHIAGGDKYICWWESGEDPFTLCPAMENLPVPPLCRFSFTVGEDGCEI